jgi:ketosteroid isomerase-like protein
MRKCFQLLIFSLCFFHFDHLKSLESDAETKSKLEIMQTLEKWPEDFNAKNVATVCNLFSEDLVSTYYGIPDRNFEEMCQNLKTVIADPDKTFTYEIPKIDQIILNNDMAIVRLSWTLKVSYKDRTNVDTFKEKGLDVMKRQTDGTWKIVISFAYPDGT